MSTQAAIFIRNENGFYSGNEIAHDGYIEISDEKRKCHGFGAGYMLSKYWQNRKDVQKLINSSVIRNLGKDYTDTEFYNWKQPFFNKSFAFNEIKEFAYSYIYIFNKNDEWVVLKPDSIHFRDNFLNLSCFLNYNDPERFFDHETFWN